MIFDPPDYRKGDALTAAQENAANEELRRIGSLSGSAGIVVSSDGSLYLDLPERFFLKLTSTANANGGYAWKEVTGTGLGTWGDSGRVGSQADDPAYERMTRNAGLAVDGKVYEAMRNDSTGEVIFE